MKKIIFAVLMLLFTMNSCVDQGSSDIEFTLFNQTDKTVKVIGFDSQLDPNTNGKANTIIINPNSQFKVTRITGLDNNTIMSFYSLKGGVNLVKLVFNNEKIKIYDASTMNSPCYICSGDDNHQYFITEEDYNTAEDCNGNCD